jgi:DNA-binding CsgD family transcriptional regulator/PAS domain-containing protein
MHDPQSAVLDRVNEAVLDPGLWPSVLDGLADLLGAREGASILSTAHSVGIWSRVDPEARTIFYSRFSPDNPIQHAVDRLRSATQTNHPLPVATDRHFFRRSAFTRTEFFNDFMSPHAAESMMVVDLGLRDVRGFLNMSCSKAKGGFSRDDLRLMTALQPALRRAFWLSVRLGGRTRLDEGFAAFFDRSEDALFLVAQDGQVRHANRAAEVLLREAGGLSVSLGRLCAPTPDATARLRALIGAAALPDGPRGTDAMAISTPGRQLPLSVLVTPVREDRVPEHVLGRSVLVSVTDLDSAVSFSERILRDLFGLTPAEIRVAIALAEGATAQEAAEALGLSFFTVRAHLARIFQKTDTHRQADLMRLLMRTVRPLEP